MEPGTFYEFSEAIQILGLLPLTSEAVHETVPHTKGIMLVGGPRSGKKSIAHAIANDVGATLFDLSLENKWHFLLTAIARLLPPGAAQISRRLSSGLG